MNDKFYFGLVLGMLGGALIASNSVKARKAVVNGQEQIVETLDELKTSAQKKKPTKKASSN